MAITPMSSLLTNDGGAAGGFTRNNNVTNANVIKDYQGKTYDTTTLLNLAKGLAPSIDANRLMGGVYSTKGESIGFDYDEATRALGYAPSAAEQVVLDMARHLMKEGVTTVDQIQATDTNRRFGSTFSGEGGTIYEIKRDADGNLVTSTWGKSTSDKGNIIAAVTIAANFMGIPADIGTAVLGQGASNLAVNTIGGAIFGAGTAALTGGDVVKGALLGGAGGAAGTYIKDALATTSPYDLSSGTNLNTMGGGQGLTQTTAGNLLDMGGGQGLTVNNLTSTTLADAINAIGGTNVANLTNLGGAQGLTLTTPNGVVSQGGVTPIGTTGSETQAVNLSDVITGNLGKDLNAINTGVNTTNVTNTTTDTTNNTTDTTKTTDTKTPFKLTPSDVIRVIQIGSTIAAIDAARKAGDNGPTQYDIVPVPTDWTSPKSIAQTWNYPTPVDFGTSDLLKGTQWEKYLTQSATPNRLNEMNYQQLLDSLKSNKPVTINDVIAGITSQYSGNVPASGLVTGGGTAANPLAGNAKVTLNNLINTLSTATADDKVKAYNDLVNTGLSDADIRTAVNKTIGNQSDADWNYLQQLATTQKPAFTLSADALTGLQSASAQEKANAYNNLLSQGYTDAQIRGSINNQVGMQSDADWQALQNLARPMQLNTLISAIGTGTPQQKAATYNQLLGQGFSDADILNAANAQFGQQSQADWTALQNLAKA